MREREREKERERERERETAAVCQNLERLGKKEESDSWLGFFFLFEVEASAIYAYMYILTRCIDVIRELKKSHLRYCI